MTVAPANTSSIIVAITGVLQDPSTYSVSGTTLTFSTAPPSDTSNISVRYLGIPASGVTTTAYRTVTEFTATSGQTSFSVPSYTVGYIDVYRNGVMLGTADFTATTGTTVVLASGATTGDLIRAESFYVSSVLNALPSTGGTLTGNLVVTGTETVPTITSPASTALTLQTNNGTTAVTIDTSQNVGIGTSSPTDTGGYGKALDLVGGSGGCAFYMRGSTNPSTVYASIQYDNGSNRTNIAAIGTGNFLRFVTVGSEVGRFDSSGSLLVGTTSSTPAGSGDTKGIALNSSGSSSQIYSTGNNDTCAVFNRAGSDGATVRLRRQGSDVGSISTTASATAYNTSSDYRLKDNVQPMTGALAKVALLKPVTFKWKIDGSDSEGFIAHELAIVKPDCVSGDKDAVDADGNPSYQGIDTSFLVATLTAALQETKALIDTQAETITQLQADVAALKGKT